MRQRTRWLEESVPESCMIYLHLCSFCCKLFFFQQMRLESQLGEHCALSILLFVRSFVRVPQPSKDLSFILMIHLPTYTLRAAFIFYCLFSLSPAFQCTSFTNDRLKGVCQLAVAVDTRFNLLRSFVCLVQRMQIDGLSSLRN